jgi:addiction module HigA family antidote
MSPGTQLAKLVKRRYRTQREAAAVLGVSPAYLGDVLADRRGISAELAVRLSRVFGAGVGERLLNRQGAVDLQRARDKIGS